MNPEPDEENLNPARNPSQSDYDKKFNKIGGSPDNRALDEEVGADTEDRFQYTGDQDRNDLAESERAGSSASDSSAAREELKEHSRNLWDEGEKGESRKSKLAGFFVGSKRSKTSKRVRLGILGGFSLFGVGLIIVIVFMAFMLVSGFGVRQAAIVLKNYGMYRVNRIGHAAITRVVEGDIRIKSGEGLAKVTPSSALDRARGLDIEKVLKNLEDEGALKYIRDADGKVTDIVFNGEEKISLDGLKRNPLKRADTLNSLSEQLERYSPELAETSNLTGKVADGIFERVSLKRLRWSEKVLAKIRETKTPTEALGVEQEAQIDKVRRDPPDIKTGDAAIDAAEEAAEKELKPIATDGVPEPTKEVIPAQLEAMEGSSRILSRSAVGDLVEGASAVIVYTLCTVNAVDKSYDGTVKQNNDASQRQAGTLYSASDQIAAGVATAAAVGAARASLADFQDQAAIAKASGNPDWKSFRQLPKTDQPQPRRDKGWMKFFHTIANAVNGAWDGARTVTGGAIIDQIPGTGNIPSTWNFTEFCQKINTPLGGLAFGVISGIIEQVALNAIWPGGGGAAGAAGKEAISEGIIKQLVNTVAEKGVSLAIKDSIESLLKGTIKSVSDRFVAKIASTLFKGGVITAATVGMSYLVIKLADGVGGHTYNGTSDQDYANKVAAGTNVMQANLMRTRNYGVPTDEKVNTAYRKQQYADYLEEQSHKSLADRFLNLNNPYSVSARIASGAPYNSSSAKTFALNILSPFNAFSSSQRGLTVLASKLTNQRAAYADSMDEDDNDGVQQWGYTLEEEELMKKEEYSLAAISEWAGTQEGKDAIARYDDKFGACYSTKNEMSDILLDESRDGLKSRCLEQLPNENKNNPNLLKWRLYHLDILSVDQTKDIQNVVADPVPGGDAGGNTGGGVGGGEISKDSSQTPCAPGTDDLGIRDDAYSNGERIKIRICAINSIAGTSEESTGVVPGANGRAIVSSIASGSWQKLGEAAKADGISLGAGSSWRTMAHQERLCREDDKCPSGNYNDVAKPGTSNHQAGTAIDISQIYAASGGPSSGRTCSNPQTVNNATYLWVAANARSFGIKNYANEAWHWGTSEKC